MTDLNAPELLVVIDTEEEFDWSRPFSRRNTATTSIPSQAAAHEIFDGLGVVPTYVIDHPVATDPAAVEFLGELKDAGRAEIGAHLHAWVSPPFEEEVNTRNSYQCNLPMTLERAKMRALTDAIARAFGERPTVFKAGRYGFGSNTRSILAELGYRIDCSHVPFTDFSSDGGPSFPRSPLDPFWLDEEETILELPLTVGYVGRAAGLGPQVQWIFDSRMGRKARVPGVLARTGLIERVRLTPEGVPAEEQIRLLATLVRQGHRTFSLTYHSPSLAPGHTPYVRDYADLRRFLDTLETVLTYFQGSLGGRFTTPSQVYARMERGRRLSAA